MSAPQEFPYPAGEPGASKRAYDVATTLGMVWFWGPTLGAFIVLVWALDGRPIFFRQQRLGRGRKPFGILKLRTMTTEADPAARRPTRLGAWLREHGFDELPQVLNVLEGSMSLVGPRPLTADDADRLSRQHAPFARRFAVKPGLTGLAQVCLARGSAQTAALDAEYARTRSAVVDTGILLRTVWITWVGKKRGHRPLPKGLGSDVPADPKRRAL